ncbi:hypothetical protein J3R30DRAFT_1496766 [Lentinula aciculospora]|uniref:Uncharacterized protein n=1 Tax=Lentinula aciculospora TaxID=153920 RepID=A0A9W9DVK6_9AGAR|nr:hypothetical protein J3R30DRAFT_1496766 [Lentinula aciculospora]
MSGATPTKRLQLKTSDLTDFFRGSSSGPSSTGSSAPPSSIAEDNRLSSSSTSPSKKRSSRIPFIGRSRKKSIHSDVDVETTLTSSDTKESRASVATAGSNYRSLLEHNDHPFTSLPHASTSQQSLKSLATSTSFGSKIAAHFATSKGGLRLQRRKSQRPTKKSHEELSDYTSDSLAPPSLGARSLSIESNVSRVSRSSTPRASQTKDEPHLQPTITVSRPPVDDDIDNLEEYNDLFTKPRYEVKPLPIDAKLTGNYISRPSLHGDMSPPSSPTLHTSSMHSHAQPYTTNRMPDDTTIRRKGSKVQNLPRGSAGDSDRASISGASISSFRALPSRRKAYSGKQQGTDIDTADESEAVSIKSAMSMPVSFRTALASEKHRSLISSNSVRSTTKSKISRITMPSKPPSIPLPATPFDENSSSLLQPEALRQRAHTIAFSRMSSTGSGSKQYSNIANTLGKSSSLSRESTIQMHSTDRNSSSSSSSSSTPTLTKTFSKSDIVDIDVDTASTEELRKALRYRNQQLEELSSRLLQMTEKHAAKMRTWKEKVAELEKEAMRKEKENKGFAWLVKNSAGGGPNTSVQSGSRTPSLVEMEKERSDDSSVRSSIPTPSSSTRLPLNRLLHSEDSESYPTSTSEWGSGVSGAEDEIMATIQPRRTMKKLKLVEARSMSLKQPGSGVGTNVSGHTSDASYPRKRSSASSSFTAASSSSSLSHDHSPTSVTFPPSQILNPIPESLLVGGLKDTHVTFSLDKEESKRERKLSKSSFKAVGQPTAKSSSIPSVTPGSRLTPSEAYIRNLKKGRPPSIAQILDPNRKTDQPTASGIEESYGGRSRALLAGINPIQQ